MTLLNFQFSNDAIILDDHLNFRIEVKITALLKPLKKMWMIHFYFRSDFKVSFWVFFLKFFLRNATNVSFIFHFLFRKAGTILKWVFHQSFILVTLALLSTLFILNKFIYRWNAGCVLERFYSKLKCADRFALRGSILNAKMLMKRMASC